MTAQIAYDHIADFIAAMNPAKLLELKAPDEIRVRLETLIAKEKDGGLTSTEKDELDHYIVLERLVRLAKAHARLKISGK